MFLLQLIQFDETVCQQNGDVRLNLFGKFYTNNGRLEVFFTEANGWVPVCYDKFNDRAAAAACRQMGHCGKMKYQIVPGFVMNYILY